MRRRRRLHDFGGSIVPLIKRDAVPDCSNVDNSIYYCYPTSGSLFYESNWTRLVWNYRNPVFTGASSLDVYLFHAESQAQVWHLSDVSNANRSLAVQVTSSWFPLPPDNDSHTSPFYYAVVPSGTTLDGSVSLGPTFEAVQTPAPMTTAGVSSSTSTLISAPTASMNISASPRSTMFVQPTEVIPSDSKGATPGLSKGAIAGITLATLLALLVLLTCIVFAIGWRRRLKDDASEGTTQRGSAEGPFKEGMQVLSRPLKSRAKISPTRSADVREPPPEALSMGDAAIMADAFRRVLRKPDWLSVRRRDSSGMILNGDDGSRPTSAMVENPDGTFTPIAATNKEAQALMEQELAGEGKGLIPVMCRRKTRVQLGANQGDPESPASPQIPETITLDKKTSETA